MSSVHGNINHAMRQNYNEFGVDEYYRKVATTYRNPFFAGIKKVIFAFMNRWWEAEGHSIGEATLCVLEWEALARGQQPAQQPSEVASAVSAISSTSNVRAPFIPPNARRAALTVSGKPLIGSELSKLSSNTPDILISATDPYTAPAYTERTSRPCHPLSFTDLSSDNLPPDHPAPDADGFSYDLIICSFALHLVPEEEMFPICYELSRIGKWLVVIAPHKKPEIKEGWGWDRWDLLGWEEAGGRVYGGGGEDGDTETELEIIREKVKLRLYRSANA
ncbi:uncharacterized protein MKK02DRAFT_38829 [Dioszegia hungarica]|uniref:Methyltransferase domain-containing protein n=1 Tax=Dioszegia hungarica TaxID=4972 RepID=A0AA38LUP6_9TREE|nr:uncharacterized protein MKK02DRAFT_38829 [Dioszegia hungarica]KAI9634156.1 hypothetical protein MKK02DRAFT_38829 [Dioszegia hungarica]